jgi:hypothetical protein
MLPLHHELAAWHACSVRSAAPRARSVVRGPCAVAAALLISVGHDASADDAALPKSVTLEWTAPAECPTRDEMLDRITSTIGKMDAAQEPVRASAVAVQEPSGEWRGDIELSVFGQTATRRVHRDSCRAVSDALALLVALVVNPDAAPAIAHEPSPAPEGPPPPAVAPAVAQRPRGRLIVGASALVDTGMLPSSSYGGELYAGWAQGRVELEIVGAGLSAVNGVLASNPTEGASFWLAHVGGRGCYEVVQTAFNLAPCVGVGSEWIVATGFGSDHPSRATGVLAVSSFGARTIAWLSSRFALRIGAEGVVPLARPSFEISNGGTVFRVPWALFRASGGAEVYF